jgi:hypothetical protein
MTYGEHGDASTIGDDALDDTDHELVDSEEEEVMLLDDAPAMELPVWEPTGDADVDAALEQLRLLDDAVLSDHVAVFTDVHAALHQRLSDIAGN